MEPRRFLVLAHLTSVAHLAKGEKVLDESDTQYLESIASRLRTALIDPETILVGRMIAMVGISSLASAQLFASIGKTLRRGDALHVVEIGDDIATTHEAFVAWHRRTRNLT